MQIQLEFHFQILKMAFKGNNIIAFIATQAQCQSPPMRSLIQLFCQYKQVSFKILCTTMQSRSLLYTSLGGVFASRTCTADFYSENRVIELTKCEHHVINFLSSIFEHVSVDDFISHDNQVNIEIILKEMLVYNGIFQNDSAVSFSTTILCFKHFYSL